MYGSFVTVIEVRELGRNHGDEELLEKDNRIQLYKGLRVNYRTGNIR